jgi:hypothetical protein
MAAMVVVQPWQVQAVMAMVMLVRAVRSIS